MTGTMTGMGGGLQTDNSTVASAFRSALDHQLLIVVLLLVGLVLAWNVVRTISYRRAVTNGTLNWPVADPHPYPEPVARHMLRITFGVLWVFDGVLQLQGSMPVGLPGSVITPAASSSPGWVQHLVNVGATIWSDHPVSAAAATVWIQVGIGLFLLAAPRGYWSRAAGAVSAGWGLVVWVFGEAFGGSSDRAAVCCSAHPAPSSSTRWPACSSHFPNRPGSRRDWARPCSGHRESSSSGWASSRPGPVAASGPARLIPPWRPER